MHGPMLVAITSAAAFKIDLNKSLIDMICVKSKKKTCLLEQTKVGQKFNYLYPQYTTT